MSTQASASGATATTTPPPPSTSPDPPLTGNTGFADSEAAKTTANTVGALGAGTLLFASFSGIFSFLFFILFSYGAAKLSYDKFGSIGWAIVDFIFATFYYPYYALFLNTPSSSSVFGGRRRR